MSLTVGVVTAGLAGAATAIGSALSSFAHAAVVVLKIVAAAALAAAFLIVITALVGFITSVIYNSIVGEFFRLVSVCLPFDPSVVFAGVAVACDLILAFLVGRKVFDLSTNLMRSSS